MIGWIEWALGELGYAGIALLMLLENVFPPIPSEVIMSMAGFVASRDASLSLWGVILAGTAGSVAGALFWYYIGHYIGPERIKAFAARHGRWITVSPADIEKADLWFDAHADWIVFGARLTPTLRTLISVPAGIFGMPMWHFLPLTALGSLLWNIALAFAGQKLGENYAAVGHYVEPVSLAVVGAMIVYYLYRIVRYQPQ